MRLSVIIVNYNVCYFLEQCLYTVLEATKNIDTEIIVVDNASADDSRNYLPGHFPGVQFIWNKENRGFGAANNQALAIAKGEYLLLLNPDTLLPQNTLSTCLEFFKTHPGAGAVGMRMFDGTGKYLPESKRGLPGPATAFYKLSGITRLFPRHPAFARYYLGHLSPETVQQVEVLAGAFFMLPKRVYEQVGGFDEQFFMYGEDIDLSYRIMLAGFTNYYLPFPGIVHFKGESTTRNMRYTRHFYEAMVLFVRKYYRNQAWIWKGILETGILFRGIFAALAKLLPYRKPKIAPNANWKIIGDARSIEELQSFAPVFNGGEQVPAWLVYALGENYGMLEVLENWMRERPSLPTRFHGKGTACIVGSDDKNGNGIIIPLKKEPPV
ncbi:glycosyltransferase family 2 protein [Flavihumibacter profundi]|uniref:glycosyltransferase family 2 protein n=1 Tax=Flavihumibacter profundi TaxID=2716883 RepID=UPI001CC414F2|nr:glycosyltransferase family 2 protein [Flavihumibacter profundi]MBZ5859049.1 glycosyltransferase [Flavihumibacter profundi]